MKSLILKDVCKSFGEKKVLESINLSFESGKVYALLGENGSGKSTLAKIIVGEVKPENGSFFFQEKGNLSELKISSPRDAIQHKIGNVSQNPTICKDLYVWENVLLGDKKLLFPFFVNKSKLIEKVKNHIDDLGISLNLEKKGSECRASEKFFVCLARTLFLEKDILILDEPTASLSKDEKSVLFGIIDRFRQQEKTVILITHNKEDALSFGDEVVFLQKENKPLVGKEALERLESFFFAGSGSATSLVNSNSDEKSTTQVDSKDGLVFAVENLFAYETPLSKIEDLSYSVEKGKITCVKGQWETGLALLEDVVSGMRTFEKGKIWFAGEYHEANSSKRFDARLLRQKGTSIIPSDKINRGSPKSLQVKDLFLGENSIQVKSVGDFIKKAKVDAKPSTKISGLSGGMLQRLILQRELSLKGDFMIFSNPTSGLDFAGIEELISTLESLKNQGKGILVLSVDDVEIEKISDFCISI